MHALRLATVVLAFSCPAALAESPRALELQAQLPLSTPHPSQYSFVDLYRLTVASGAAPAFDAAARPDAVRVSVQPAATFELKVAVEPPREPRVWMLLLAGVVLAGWVAHRRLAHSFG